MTTPGQPPPAALPAQIKQSAGPINVVVMADSTGLALAALSALALARYRRTAALRWLPANGEMRPLELSPQLGLA